MDFVELALEESPLNENTWDDAATPSRISTVLVYPPARSARMATSPQHLRRNDELRGILGEVKRLIETYEPAGILTSRLYADHLPFYLALAGWTLTRTAGGAGVTEPLDTTVTGVNALNSPVINVASTAGFKAAGSIVIGAETITYTGKTATSFTGCGNHAATVGGEAVFQNVPAGANKWVATKRDAIDAKTARMRINYQTENVLMQAYGTAIASLAINAEGELSADLMALYMRRLVADGATVPSILSSAIAPLRRGDLFVSALASGGRLADFTVNVANPLERIRTLSLDPPSDWPDALEYGDDQVMVSGTIPKRILDGDDLDALEEATSFALEARWRRLDSTIAATGHPYGVWLESPAAQLVSGEPDELGNRRRHGLSLDWAAHYDEVAGYDARWTIINNVTAIETYA